MGVHFEAQNPITGESLPLTGQEMLYGLNINTGEKFSQTLAWLLDQINDERINDGEEYWYFSSQGRDLAWDELKDDGFFEAETSFETDWERGQHDPTADVVDITADPIRNRVYVTVRFYTKKGLSSYDIIYSGDLKQSGAADLVLSSETAYSMIEYQDDHCLKRIVEQLIEPMFPNKKFWSGTSWNINDKGDMVLTVYPDGDPNKQRLEPFAHFTFSRQGMAEALKAVGYENPESWGAESYTNPITGQPNFVLISEHIRDGEYERYEYFVIDAESEAKMSDKEILEWQYGEGSVDESGYGDNQFWVHGERLHEIEAQPISFSDALVLERLRIASRNYPYQDLDRKEAEDDYVCQCGSHELRYVEYDNPEGNGFFCMNCGLSPCGIRDTDNKPCTCDLDEFFHRSKSYDAETSENSEKTLVAIDLIHESAEYCDYFIIPTAKLSGFDEQEIVSYFYDLHEEDWDEDGTSFSSFMSFPTEVSSVMTWSITPEEEKVLNKFGIRQSYKSI